MQAKLHLVKGNPKGKQVEVPEGILTVGRAEDRDLIIASTRVSRRHCRITNDTSGLTLRDNDSGNGTLVNGQRVTEQKLEPGDHVTIGPLTFLVEVEGVKEKPEAKPAPEAPDKPQLKPQAKPKGKAKPKAKPAEPTKPPTEDDILASLEHMSGGKGGGSSNSSKKRKKKPSQPGAAGSGGEDDDTLQISDDDLLDM